MPLPAPGRDEGGDQDCRDHQGRAQVALEQDQAERADQQDQVGGEAVLQVPQALAALDQPGRHEEGEGQLGELGGLDHQRAGGEPAAGAIDLDTQQRYQHQQHRHDHGPGQDQGLQVVVVDPHQGEHRRRPEAGGEQLTLEVIERRQVLHVSQRLACAEHEDEPGSHQQHRHQEQPAIALPPDGALGPFGSLAPPLLAQLLDNSHA